MTTEKSDARRLYELVCLRDIQRDVKESRQQALSEATIAYNQTTLDISALVHRMDREGTLTDELERMTWETT